MACACLNHVSKRLKKCIKRKNLGPCTLKYHTTAKPAPNSGQFDMQCDENGDFKPIQCDSDVSKDYAYCFCVDKEGNEIGGAHSDEITNSTEFCQF